MKDWEHAVKWLQEQDWVDPDRIGVFGGSYGGFAVLTCVTRLPRLLGGGGGHLRPVQPRHVREGGAADVAADDEASRWAIRTRTPTSCMERSPITYIENVKTPLLVIQGAKDPRVVKAESDQLVDKLRELGREVEYVVFEDEGHGFTKRQNEVRAMTALRRLARAAPARLADCSQSRRPTTKRSGASQSRSSSRASAKPACVRRAMVSSGVARSHPSAP